MTKSKSKKTKKRVPRRTKLTGDDRVIELLETLIAMELYLNTDLSHKEVAKRLGVDNARVSEILKGVKRDK